MATSVLLAIAFIVLGSEVLEDETHRFDEALLRIALDTRASHTAVAQVFRDLTTLGGATVVTLTTVLACVYLAAVDKLPAVAVVVASATGSGALAVHGLKQFLGRARPDPAFADAVVSGLSFPSGHSSMAALTYLTLGAIMASTRSGRAARVFFLTVPVAIVLLVGVSRVVLGVHWPTDVLGGWAFGAAWATGWLVIVRLGTPRAVRA